MNHNKMLNNSLNNETQTNNFTLTDWIAAYYPIGLIVVGTILNILTFIILCRPVFNDPNKRPIIHYMRVISVFDVLMLYGWNLEHYLEAIPKFPLEQYSVASCKFFQFFNYFILQTSAWIRVFICLDRYLALSCLHRTWFNRSKSVIIIISLIMIVFALFNFHLIIFACYRDTDGSVNLNGWLYSIYPLWDTVNLVVYNCIPFICMLILNSGVVYHLIVLRHATTIQNSHIQYRAISVTLVLTTLLFSIMTIPGVAAYAFFRFTAHPTVLFALGSLLYTYHITSFPLYLITFKEFRRETIKIFTWPRRLIRIRPA